ncbi:hypothetical protein LG274_02655 [Micrococcus antarcticus]|uniref:hypothetical protein n=1 Tax=Micrococcus antarcticus TaxID=86171 RepID=UPI00384FC03F
MAETENTTSSDSLAGLLQAFQARAADTAAVKEPDTDETPEVEETEDEGKGGKAAVLADLAKERDARQALSAELDELKTLLGQKLGLTTPDATVDPATQARIDAAEASARDARTQVAVVRNAPEDADVAALLDSSSFTRHMADVDPDDAKAVRSAVKSFLSDHPRFSTEQRTTASAPRRGTVRDAGARTTQRSAPSMDDLIRGRA